MMNLEKSWQVNQTDDKSPEFVSTNTDNVFKIDPERILYTVGRVIKDAEDNNQVNEQWFINWLDKLNKLSTKY